MIIDVGETSWPSVEFFHHDLATHGIARAVHGHGESDVFQDAFLRSREVGSM